MGGGGNGVRVGGEMGTAEPGPGAEETGMQAANRNAARSRGRIAFMFPSQLGRIGVPGGGVLPQEDPAQQW